METLEGHLKTIVKGAGIFLIGLFLSKFFNYFFRIIIARMGTESYGIINLALSFVNVLAVIACLGLSYGVVRYLSFYNAKGEENKVRGIIIFSLKTTLILGVVLGLSLFIFSGVITRLLFPKINQEILISILKIISPSVPLIALTFILFASFEALKTLKYEVYTKNIFDGAFKVAFTFLAVYLGFGIFGIIFIYIASLLGSVLLSLYYLNKYIPLFKFGTKPDYINKELLLYSLPLILSGLCSILMVSVNSWVLGFFTGASDVGLYNAALPTAQMLYMISSMILILFLPVLAELYAKDDKDSFRLIYKTVTKWIFFVNLPLLGLFFVFSKELLGILFGSNFISSSTALMILSIGFFLNSLVLTSESILMVIKNTKLIFISYLTGVITNTLFSIYLVPKYGINGAAIASSFSFTIISLFFIFGSYNSTKLLPFNRVYLKGLISLLLTSALTYFVKQLVKSQNIYSNISFMVFFVLLYLGMLFIFKSFDKNDIMILRSVRNKFDSMVFNRLK